MVRLLPLTSVAALVNPGQLPAAHGFPHRSFTSRESAAERKRRRDGAGENRVLRLVKADCTADDQEKFNLVEVGLVKGATI